MTTRQDDLKTLCARGDLNSSQTGSISVHPRSSETFLSVELQMPMPGPLEQANDER
jgi:hypothetical protein